MMFTNKPTDKRRSKQYHPPAVAKTMNEDWVMYGFMSCVCRPDDSVRKKLLLQLRFVSKSRKARMTGERLGSSAFNWSCQRIRVLFSRLHRHCLSSTPQPQQPPPRCWRGIHTSASCYDGRHKSASRVLDIGIALIHARYRRQKDNFFSTVRTCSSAVLLAAWMCETSVKDWVTESGNVSQENVNH